MQLSAKMDTLPLAKATAATMIIAIIAIRIITVTFLILFNDKFDL